MKLLLLAVVVALVEADFFQKLERRATEITAHAGYSLCDNLDPCHHGMCSEDEHGYKCQCAYPFTGMHCDIVNCNLELCWLKAWEGILGHDTLTKPTEGDESTSGWVKALRRQGGRSRRSLKRQVISEVGSQGIEHLCTMHMEATHQCLEEGLLAIKNATKKCHCNAESIEHAFDTVMGGKDKLVDEYCGVQNICKDPRATKCVAAVELVVDTFSNLRNVVKPKTRRQHNMHHTDISITDFLMAIETAETCVEGILEERIFLTGCEQHRTTMNGKLLFLLEGVRAEIKGCPFSDISDLCGLTRIEEGKDICKMNPEETKAEISRVMSCIQRELLAMKDQCSAIIKELVHGIWDTLFDAKKKCARHAGVEMYVEACKKSGSMPANFGEGCVLPPPLEPIQPEKGEPSSMEENEVLSGEDSMEHMPSGSKNPAHSADQGPVFSSEESSEEVESDLSGGHGTHGTHVGVIPENSEPNPEPNPEPSDSSHEHPSDAGQTHNGGHSSHMESPSAGMESSENDNPMESEEMASKEDIDNSIPAMAGSDPATSSHHSHSQPQSENPADNAVENEDNASNMASQNADDTSDTLENLRSLFRGMSRSEQSQVFKRLLSRRKITS